MAVRKLPLSLFSPKSRASKHGCSMQYFHFIVTFSKKKDQYALLCESQPLMTSRSHDLPAACPTRGAQIHPKENANANHQG
jgi:hypothetical protein